MSLPHEPTTLSRAQVSALMSFGHTQEEVALFLGICVDTMAKYYRNELDTAVIRANSQVAGKLFKKAVDQDDLAAQIFWLKCRARWRTADSEDKKQSSQVDQLFTQPFIE